MNSPNNSKEFDSVEYYNQNAELFYTDTVGLDISALADRFLKHLPFGAQILDAGCGSGRDSLYFTQQGYQVTAFDASRPLVRLASQLTGLDVIHTTFLEFKTYHKFDGIWACASLIHVPRNQIQQVIIHLAEFLKPGGLFYVSFKYGDQEEVRRGRFFNDYTEETFAKLASTFPHISLYEIWTSIDIRPNRSTEIWLNAILNSQESE
jgi:SAM-dependent methyltransferase